LEDAFTCLGAAGSAAAVISSVVLTIFILLLSRIKRLHAACDPVDSIITHWAQLTTIVKSATPIEL